MRIQYLLENYDLSCGWVPSSSDTGELEPTRLVGQVAEDVIEMCPEFIEGSVCVGENNLPI